MIEDWRSCVVEENCRTERGIYAPDWAVVRLRQKVPPAILRCLVCVMDLLLLMVKIIKVGFYCSIHFSNW